MTDENIIERAGIKFIRPVYTKGNGIALHLTGGLATVCGMEGVREVEIELLKDGAGFIVRAKPEGNAGVRVDLSGVVK